MKKLILFLFFSVTILAGVYWLGIQAAYLVQNRTAAITFDWSLLWFRGSNDYFYLLTFIALFFILDVLYNLFFSRRDRERRKEERRLTRDEKRSFAHIASLHESKKGLQRLQFDQYGYQRPLTVLNTVDQIFDPLKKLWNRMIVFFRISDVHKWNTLRHWSIDGTDTCRRGGLPVLTYRHRVYVDADESHSLIIGTTNSGKTFSVIDIMIDTLRMAGESMVINDLKGELLKIHKEQLVADGYQVIELNFVEPNKSDCWNPLGIITAKYRQAQMKYLNESQASRDLFLQMKDLKRQMLQEADPMKRAELSHKIELLGQNAPEPDYSEAQELLKDIANTLCYDPNARDPFWNSQAGILLEGLVDLLLEEGEEDPETGEFVPLDDSYINLKSVKLMLQEGNKPIDREGKKTILSDYLNNYRKPTDASVMKLKEYTDTAQNTKGSITSVFSDKLDIAILNESIMRMTSATSFDMKSLGKKKTAIFLVVHDEKKTYYPLVSIFVKQLYEELIKTAREEESLKLSIPVNLIFDEFGISPALKDIDSILAAARSRGVRMTMVVQDFSQLDTNYGKDVAKSIKNNVMNMVYLLGGDPETLKEVSRRAGDRLVWNKEKGSFDTEPVISTERLSRLSMGEAVILRQRRNPIITRLKGYNQYCFYRNKPMNGTAEERPLAKVRYFDLEKAWRHRKEMAYFSKAEQSANVQRKGSGLMKDATDSNEFQPKLKDEYAEIKQK